MNNELLFSPLVERIGWTLLHSVWQFSLLAAALALALAAMRGAAASKRHGFALAAMVLMATCPVVTFFRMSPEPAPGFPPTLVGVSIVKTSIDVSEDGTGVPRALSAPLPAPAESIAAVPPDSSPKPSRWFLPPSVWTKGQLGWAVGIWGLGVLAVLTWRMLGWVRLLRWKGEATPLDDPRMADLKARLGVRRPVRVCVTVQPLAPMLLGGLKPVILIPASVLSCLAPRQIESLLAHELAHLRRRDDWALWMQTAVETLLFFHPAVWWVGGVLRREREFAADDLAVAALSDRTAYVQAMARMAELCADRGAPSLGATTGGPMITRLRRLLDKPNPPARVAGGASGAAAAGLALAAFWIWPASSLQGVGMIPSPPRANIFHTNPAASPHRTTKVSAPGTNTDLLVVEKPLPAEGDSPNADPSEKPDPPLIDPAPASEKPVPASERRFPTRDEGMAAARVVEAFLAADSVEEKLQFVRFPDKIKPHMERWYAGHPDSPIRPTRDELAESLTKFINVEGTRFTIVTMLVKPGAEYKIFCVESSPMKELKVDWETAVGWQAMPLKKFSETRPTTPQPFRVQAAPGDYYNGYYSDASKWCAVDLSYPGHPEFKLFGYVERSTPAGERLMKKLGCSAVDSPTGGEREWESVQAVSCPLILSIAYPNKVGDPKQVTIHDVLQDGWFLADGPAFDLVPR